MQVELSLVLDTLGKYRLPLKTGTNFEIDEYTSKNFVDSSQIREKFQKEINEFLELHKQSIINSNKPNYKGRIVIVVPEKIEKGDKYFQRRVLYKKHIVTLDKFLKDKSLMIKYSLYERNKKNEEKNVSEYFHKIIRMPWTKTNSVRKYINEWIKSEKDKRKNYYEIIRDMMIVYERQREYIPNLLSFDEIYEEYLNLQSEKRTRKSMKLEKSNHQIVEDSIAIEPVVDEYSDEYIINGVKYTIDELHLLDLEDFNECEDDDYLPDGAKRI